MIGQTIYIYDSNRRQYVDDNGNPSRTVNERYRYRPLEITGETSRSWIAKSGEKIGKKTGAISGGGNFGLAMQVKWSLQEVEDELERKRLTRMMYDINWNACTLDQLRQIAAVLGIDKG